MVKPSKRFFIKENFIKKFRRRFTNILSSVFIKIILKKKRTDELANKYNCSSNDVALSWVIDQKFPSYAIIGSKNVSQLSFSMNSLNIVLSDEEKKWLSIL